MYDVTGIFLNCSIIIIIYKIQCVCLCDDGPEWKRHTEALSNTKKDTIFNAQRRNGKKYISPTHTKKKKRSFLCARYWIPRIKNGMHGEHDADCYKQNINSPEDVNWEQRNACLCLCFFFGRVFSLSFIRLCGTHAASYKIEASAHAEPNQEATISTNSSQII